MESKNKKSMTKDTRQTPEHKAKVKEAARRVMVRYDSTLRKLAK